MSKSKSLAVMPPLDGSIAHLRGYHQIAMNAASQTACGAVMVGLELRKVQQALKKSTKWTFDAWLDEHQDEIGFGRSTAFKYLAIADSLKGKLLKQEDRSVVGFLDIAPSELKPHQVKSLLLAVRKSIDGKSLTELYEDFEIVRRPHGASLRDAEPSGGGGVLPPVPVEQLVDEQLELFGQYTLSLEKTHKVGDRDVLLIASWPKAKLKVALEAAKRSVVLLNKILQEKAS